MALPTFSTLMTPDPSRFSTRMLEELSLGLESILSQETQPGAMDRLRVFQEAVLRELDRRREYRSMLDHMPPHHPLHHPPHYPFPVIKGGRPRV